MAHTPSFETSSSVQQEATVPLRARHVKDAMLPVGTRSGRPLMGAERERKIA
jgi:hypothetical protein